MRVTLIFLYIETTYLAAPIQNTFYFTDCVMKSLDEVIGAETLQNLSGDGEDLMITRWFHFELNGFWDLKVYRLRI